MNIKLCLGSSCFARGNAEVLTFLEEYITKNKLDAKIDLSGCRCENCCSQGPNVFIDGQRHSGITQEKLKDLIDKSAGKK